MAIVRPKVVGTEQVGVKAPVARERATFIRPLLTEDMAKDPKLVARAIQQMTDSAVDASRGSRGHPLGAPYIAVGVVLVNGRQAIIRHSLGQPFKYWHPIRQYAQFVDPQDTNKVIQTGSSFAAIEDVSANWPQGLTAANALVLKPTASGQYDIAIYSS